MAEAALVLVCKRPELGVGKQRLAASLGQEAANRVAQALLACALEDVRAWPGPVVIAPAHWRDCAWAEALLADVHPEGYVQHQAEGNLGERLNMLDCKLRSAGLEKLVYIGSDAPALGQTDYAGARKALKYHDTVLAPAADGGVVLMASRKQWPRLADLPWSTPRLGAALADCCRAVRQSVTVLAHCFDVDEKDDLVRLITFLSHDQRPARRALHQLAGDLVQFSETEYVQF